MIENEKLEENVHIIAYEVTETTSESHSEWLVQEATPSKAQRLRLKRASRAKA